MGTPGRSWTDRRVLNHSPTGPSFSNTTPSNGHAQGLRKTYSNPLEKQEAEALFETPSDLVCPITQDILLDPVINGAGQVYERSAIEEHLSRRSTDPVTGQQLSKKDLTPVWILRSKALEYRENTARQCVERASSSSCTFPERYVRRAAELCAGLDLPVQGLSRECVQYTLTHASNAYDTAILQLFAQGLFDAGYRDKAATVYYSLLRNEVDRSQQVDLLRRCLSCWTCEQNSGVDEPLIQKLGQLVEQQHTFSWTEIIDIVFEAGLGDEFCVRLCEQLLFATELPSSPSSNSRTDGHEWVKQKQILVKYVQLFCRTMTNNLNTAAERLDKLERMIHMEGVDRHSEKEHPQWQAHVRRGAIWLRKRGFATVAFVVGTLSPSTHPLFRIMRLAPLLFMLKGDDEKDAKKQ
eukprot:jgi/Botrbrau1/18788/Bobra.0386s0104.1